MTESAQTAIGRRPPAHCSTDADTPDAAAAAVAVKRALREAIAMTGIHAPALFQVLSGRGARIELGGLDAVAAAELAKWIEARAKCQCWEGVGGQ